MTDRFAELEERMGATLYRQRLNMQKYHATQAFGYGRTLTHIENVEWIHKALTVALKCAWVYGIGYRNFRDLRIVQNHVALPHLPKSFEGFSIAHISDIHLEMDPTLWEVLAGRLDDAEYDVLVITGDFKDETMGPHEPMLELLGKLVGHIEGPAYAVLGNHDFVEIVPGVEERGIRILLNENVAFERDGEEIYLAGIDDPHFYQTDNFEKATAGIPHDAVSILLSHSPEVYRKAAACGFDLMLCGHTHGGQICLPGGFPVFLNAVCPGRMAKGCWRYHHLQGYTSNGAGASGVPVRYFCPPEIVVHRLTRGSP